MKLKITSILGKAAQTINRYPFTLFYSLLMTMTAIYLAESDYLNKESNFIALKILIVSSLGISLSFALQMLTQRNRKFKIFEFFLILFLLGYYFILPKNEEDFTEVYVYLLIPTYILAHLLVAIVPYLSREETEIKFWEYNKKLFINFFLTIVFTGVLCGGIELAILAVDHLFNINFKYLIYYDTFLFFLIFGSTFIFTLFNIDGLYELEKKVEYPVVLKFFSQFILIPLLIIYLVILYIYSFKILLQWELPRGWVTYLVLAYSILGIFALLLVHPLKEQTNKSWVKLFSQIFYFSLIPLLILLFVAIFTRLLEYGFTEPRYFVLLLAVWISLIFVYFVFYKKANIKFIPISLFVFGLFALIFPFLNAFSVSKNSQKKELVKILTENNLLKDGKIDFNQTVEYTLVNELEDKFDYLDERNERDFLLKFLVDEQAEKALVKDFRFWSFNAKFDSVIYEKNTGKSQYTSLRNLKKSYEVESFDRVISSNAISDENFKINEDEFKFITDENQYKVVMNQKDSIDLMPEIKEFFEDQMHENNMVDDLSIDFELGKYKFKLVFNHINFSSYRNSATYFFNEMYLLVKY